MARPRHSIKVQRPPRVKGFIPVGYYGDKREAVILNIEEYESIRLLDYENLSQVEAAEMMDVSRPTLTRIYDRARKKMARALMESLEISIEGGTAVFNDEWYECETCSSRFNSSVGKEKTVCPICVSTNINELIPR